MNKLQLALDLTDLGQALELASSCASEVDVIEAGTVLCLASGLEAVSKLRERLPDANINADIRIARAGGKLAKMAFGAGASSVTCVAEAPYPTIKQAAEAADQAGGKLQIELGEDWNHDDAERWLDLGIDTVICHHSPEIEQIGGGSWTADALAHADKVTKAGLKVIAAGSVDLEAAMRIAKQPVDTVVCGRCITAAEDPVAAARQIKAALQEN